VIILTDVSLIMNSMVGRDSSSLEKLLVYEDDKDEVVWSGSCGVSSGMLMCLFWSTEELLRKSPPTISTCSGGKLRIKCPRRRIVSRFIVYSQKIFLTQFVLI